MLTRLISGLIGIGVFLGCCFGGLLPFTVAVLIVTALGISEFVGAYEHVPVAEPLPGRWEWVRAHFRRWNPILAWAGLAMPLLAYLFSTRSTPLLESYALLLGAVVLLFAALVVRALRTGHALGALRAAYGLVGFLYIGGLLEMFVLLRAVPGVIVVAGIRGEGERGAWLMLFVAVCVWATDTFAYFVGRWCGRHKLAPQLSPGKTIEGSIGGLVGAILVGATFGHWIHLPLAHGVAVGTLAGVVGQVGDLFESALKRELGIKDFGRFLPGHGGALDRFDSLLFVAPLAYLYLHFVAGI
jgi:phosphatidate cytidylyltransferase